MLHVNPKMLTRLSELEADLLQPRTQAEAEGWIGEIEGIDLFFTFLRFLRAKRDETQRRAQRSAVHLGIPHAAVRRSPNDAPQSDASKQRAVRTCEQTPVSVCPDHSVTGRHSASRSTTSRQARCACRG